MRNPSLAFFAVALMACSEPKATSNPPHAAAPAQPELAKPDREPAPVANRTGTPDPSTAPLGQRLAKAFSGYEYVPTREDLLKVAPEAELVPALWTLYHAPDQRLAVRTQALVSLRFFPSEQVQSWFETVLRDPATVDAVRRPAAKAYGFAFGERAVAVLGELLAHADLHTRDSAARALGAIGTAAARQKLSERAKIESEASVQATLAAELAKPERKP